MDAKIIEAYEKDTAKYDKAMLEANEEIKILKAEIKERQKKIAELNQTINEYVLRATGSYGLFVDIKEALNGQKV
jgi:predicted RNase H-like nuclease (RuvC/YqgF family)